MKIPRTLPIVGTVLAVAAAAVLAGAATAPPAPSLYTPTQGWWPPGDGPALPSRGLYDDPEGSVGLLNASGDIATTGHPFFQPIGTNGRACVTCHQPEDGMSLSAVTAQSRWDATHGADPLFAAIDGSNCPSLPQDQVASHSLLLKQGLIRVFLPWPPKRADGTAVKPQFDLEVVKDPTGCNTDPVYGLKSVHPTVSVFRRPRVVANLKFVTQGGAPFNVKDGTVMDRDPLTGRFVNMDIMADSREPTLRTQAIDAALTHLQAKAAPSDAQLKQILAFESQIYSAQARSSAAGDLTEQGGPSGLGPKALRDGSAGLGDNFYTPIFGYFDQWAKSTETSTSAEFRRSVARGMEVFFTRPFYIRDVTHLNTVGLGNPVRRTCATCHNAKLVGMDFAPGYMDLGTGNRPWSQALPTTDDLPLFKLTCHTERDAHPYLGKVVFTHDPGRALISGRCADIGAITMQQFRGLAARAPYFSNGSAATLMDLVEYYNKRFGARYTDQEKQDLVNFLGVL